MDPSRIHPQFTQFWGCSISDISHGASWLANMVFINVLYGLKTDFSCPANTGGRCPPPPPVLIAVHVFKAKVDQPVCPVWKASAMRDVLRDDDRQRANRLLEYSRTFLMTRPGDVAFLDLI